MASYGFHSEAADEYLAAIRYYLDHASPLVAAVFVADIEAAIQTLLASPTTWPVIEEPQIRRYLLKDFRIQFIIAGKRTKKKLPYTQSCISENYLGTGVLVFDR